MHRRTAERESCDPLSGGTFVVPFHESSIADLAMQDKSQGNQRHGVSVSKVGGKFRTTGMVDGSSENPPSIFRDGPRCVPPERI